VQTLNVQLKSRLQRRARSPMRRVCLLWLAVSFTVTGVELPKSTTSTTPTLAWRLAAPAAQARDQDRDTDRQMRDFEREQRRAEREQRREEREQRREERWRQKEAAEETRQREREARDDAPRVGTDKTDGGASQPLPVKSDASSTTAKESPSSGSSQGPNRPATSSTTDGAKKDERSNDPDDRQERVEITGPPPTVEKWFKQLIDPKPVKTVRATAPIAPAKKDKQDQNASIAMPPQSQNASPAKPADAPQTAQPDKAAAKSNPTTSVTAGPNTKAVSKSKTKETQELAPIEFPEFPMPEVLAIDASSETLSRARELGFKSVTSTTLAGLNLNIRTLLPPKGMTSATAQALLKRKVPDGTFAANKKYRIYRTASHSGSPPRGQPAAAVAGDQVALCGADRCFARDIIGWTPELRSCAPSMKIGIIDTAVDVLHPTFQNSKIETVRFSRADALAPNWHGTGVTALLAGDSQSGTPGLIPNAAFYVADIFHADEDAEPASDTLSMLRAFDWMEAKGVKIINMSLAGPPDALIQKAVANLSAKGILLVAAAGNEGPAAGPSYPAAYDQVIAVTAVNKNLQNYRYANRGDYIDIAAPGVAIWTALPGAQQGYHSGTSFATPYVTASLAALYPRIAGQSANNALQALQFLDLGDPGVDPVYGRRLVRAPASCTGGQVASRPGVPAAPTAKPAPTAWGLLELSVAETQSQPAETLPWLGLQGTGQ
jgi:hypothetical protein